MDLMRHHINVGDIVSSSKSMFSSVTNLVLYGCFNLLAIIVIVITLDIFVRCFHYLKAVFKLWHDPLKLTRLRAGQDNLVAVERPEGLPYKTINTRRGNAMRWVVIDHIREKPVRTKRALLYILSRQKRKAMENITAQSLYHKIDAYEPVERFYPLHIKPMDIMFYIPERKLEQMEFVVNKLRKPSLESIVSDVTWEGSSDEEDESDEDYIVDLKTDKIQMNLDRCETFVNEIEQYYFKKDRRPGFSPYSRSESRARSPYTSIYERDAFLPPTSKAGIGIDVEIIEREKRLDTRGKKQKTKIFSDPLLYISGDARKVRPSKGSNLIDPFTSYEVFGMIPQRSLSDQTLNWKRKVDIVSSFEKRGRKDVSRSKIISNQNLPDKPDKNSQPEGSSLPTPRNQGRENRRSDLNDDLKRKKFKKKKPSTLETFEEESPKEKKNIFVRLFNSSKSIGSNSKSKVSISESNKVIQPKSKTSFQKLQSKMPFFKKSDSNTMVAPPVEISDQTICDMHTYGSNVQICKCREQGDLNCNCKTKMNRARYIQTKKLTCQDQNINAILSKLKRLRRISEQVASRRDFNMKTIENTDICNLAISLESRLNEYKNTSEINTLSPVKEIIPAISTLSKTLISMKSTTDQEDEEKVINKINMQLFYLNSHLKDVLYEITPVKNSSFQLSSID